MIEIFKDIAGYEGLYQVSNLGRVKSLNYNHTNKERILSPANLRGYYRVTLQKDGNRKTYFVHRLVAHAFLENPDNLSQINHIDQNKQNNKVDNLEWCTGRYNKRYSAAKKIGCYKDNKLIKIYDAIIDTQKDGFNYGNVGSALRGKLSHHKGFQWRYE